MAREESRSEPVANVVCARYPECRGRLAIDEEIREKMVAGGAKIERAEKESPAAQESE